MARYARGLVGADAGGRIEAGESSGLMGSGSRGRGGMRRAAAQGLQPQPGIFRLMQMAATRAFSPGSFELIYASSYLFAQVQLNPGCRDERTQQEQHERPSGMLASSSTRNMERYVRHAAHVDANRGQGATCAYAAGESLVECSVVRECAWAHHIRHSLGDRRL